MNKLMVAMVIILADRMWKKLPPDPPAVSSPPEQAATPGVEPPDHQGR